MLYYYYYIIITVHTAMTDHGGERKNTANNAQAHPVTSKCTQICGNLKTFSGKSCAKTILVNVYPEGAHQKAIRVYAIIDDQSNASLARSEIFNQFDIQGEELPYTLSSCAGSIQTHGRRTGGIVLESLDGSRKLNIPSLLECADIPDMRNEIPTPDVANCHAHLKDIAGQIPSLDDGADILLLVGRDVTDAHHVLDQRIGPPNSPYAQKLPLGWVIIGETCLGKVHMPNIVNANKTYILRDGRESHFKPCPSEINVMQAHDTHFRCKVVPNDTFGTSVFVKTKDDEKLGLSVEDKQFLDIMDSELHRDSQGHWVAPLPFRIPRSPLPNNKSQAINRAMMLDRSLKKNLKKQEHFMTFMEKVINNNHAEIAPPLQDEEECWYLPIFGVYHSKKPDQIRAVFDSSAQFEGVSLNNTQQH